MDLLIAAHGISIDVRLITHNVKEFGKVPGLRSKTGPE
jgi:predicted nucleic acid-binding protein